MTNDYYLPDDIPYVLRDKFYTHLLGKKPYNAGWPKSKRIIDRPILKKTSTKSYGIGFLTGEVNNLTVIDIDVKADNLEYFNKHLKKLFFKNKKPITHAEYTPSGGLHFYFEYVKGLPNKINLGGYGIDILTDGKQVASSPSEGYKIIQGRNINSINPLPTEIFQALIELEPKGEYQPLTKLDYKNNVEKTFLKSISNEQICEVLNKIGKKKLSDYDTWLKFTTALKSIDAIELWDEYSKKAGGYDVVNNMKIWNSIKNPVLDLNYICILAGCSTFKPIKTYNALINSHHEITINHQYIPHNLYDDNNTVIIKSATGTGKTQSVATYYKQNNTMNMLSICSRISLVKAQYDAFKKQGITMRTYLDEKNNKNLDHGENLITQIDSLIYFNIDSDYLNNCILFLDEIASLIKYLTTSETMKTKRSAVWDKFIYIVKNVKQIIGVDADTDDMTLEFIEKLRKGTIFIKNTYKNGNHIRARRYKTEKGLLRMMMRKINKKEYFTVCCDTAEYARSIYERINKKVKNDKVILHIGGSDIEAENVNELWLKKWVIYSPKIVYGVDFNPKKAQPVFLMGKGKTITPLAMAQQIARNRNISEIHYMVHKISDWSKFSDIGNVKRYLCNNKNDWVEEYHNMGLNIIDKMDNNMKALNEVIDEFQEFDNKIVADECDIKRLNKLNEKYDGIEALVQQYNEYKDCELFKPSSKSYYGSKEHLDMLNKCLEKMKQEKERILNNTIGGLYLDMKAYDMYYKDIFNTSPLYHFEMFLREKGFIICDADEIEEDEEDEEDIAEAREIKEEIKRKDKITYECETVEEVLPQYRGIKKQMNKDLELLKVPYENRKKIGYWNIFINNIYVNKLFDMKYGMIEETDLLMKRLTNRRRVEFKENLEEERQYKLIVIKKACEVVLKTHPLLLKHSNHYKDEIVELPDEDYNKLKKFIRGICKYRPRIFYDNNKKPTMKQWAYLIYTLLNDVLGSPFICKKPKKDNKKEYDYCINEPFMDIVMRIIYEDINYVNDALDHRLKEHYKGFLNSYEFIEENDDKEDEENIFECLEYDSDKGY